jgi:hypothetical protein
MISGLEEAHLIDVFNDYRQVRGVFLAKLDKSGVIKIALTCWYSTVDPYLPILGVDSYNIGSQLIEHLVQ